MNPPLPVGTTWFEDDGYEYKIVNWSMRRWATGARKECHRQTCSAAIEIRRDNGEWARARSAHDPREIARIKAMAQRGGRP